MNDAYISIKDVVYSWLGVRRYPIHYYVKALILAVKGLRLLNMRSMPLVHHKLLTRGEEKYFALPTGFENYISVAVRHGDHWHPVPINDRLMPFPNNNGAGDTDSDFDDDMNVSRAYASWYAEQSTQAGFNPAQFSSGSFSTASNAPAVATDPWQTLLRYVLHRGVAFDLANSLIILPEYFPYTEIYLVYTGLGNIDVMTHIPVIAQPALEAYIDWKYVDYKRGSSRGDAGDWERKFQEMERLLRSHVQRWTVQDISDAFETPFDYRTLRSFSSASILSGNPYIQ